MDNILSAKVLMSHLPEITDGAYKTATEIAIEALRTIDKIGDVIKIEQQSTSCEYTKLKSFEIIEKLVKDYQLRI